MGSISFRHSQLVQTLAEHVPDRAKLHFKRLISFSEPPTGTRGPITLRFSDGSTDTADVLVGADGVHSVTRHLLLPLVAADARRRGNSKLAQALEAPGKMNPVWSGTCVYYAKLSREKLERLYSGHRCLKSNINVSRLLP